MSGLAKPSLALGPWITRLAGRLRRPSVTVGGARDPYMRRWHIVPRNRWFNVYLHHIRRDDDDRALHDHPWHSLSLILRGGYVEVTASGRRRYRRGALIYRRPTFAHRLELDGGGAWTVFVTGPRVREWGFLCPQGWVPWREFTAADDPGVVGRGCGELP